MAVRSLVLTGYGINSEMETAYANRLAGADTTIAHINDVIDGKFDLEDYHILNFPGGFSYGDDLGSGKAFANKILYAQTPRGPMMEQIRKFIDDGKLIIGICNGFQILAKMGLLPAFDKKYTDPTTTVFYNDKGFRGIPESQCRFPVYFYKGHRKNVPAGQAWRGQVHPRQPRGFRPPVERWPRRHAIRGCELYPEHAVPVEPEWLRGLHRRHLRRDGQGFRLDAPPRSVQPYHEPPAICENVPGI